MIIRSICIWIALFAILGYLMPPDTSSEQEQKLIELNERIARTQAAYKREKNLKVELLEERQVLSNKIEHEIKRGQAAKRQLEKD